MSEQSQGLDMFDLLAKARSYIERLMPDPAYRTSLLKVFARTIRLMHSQNPNSWGINFGRNGPFLLIEHEWALDSRSSSKELSFHVYLKSMDENTRLQLEKDAIVKIDKADLWSEVTIRLPEQEQLINLIWPAFNAYIESKIAHKIHTSSIPSHKRKGAGLVQYIRVNGIDPDLPQPGYVNQPHESTPNGQGHPPLPDGGMEPLKLTDLVSSFAASCLSFTPWQIATFYTALQTKGFVILSGISGMGKTKLAQAFARLLPQPVSKVVIPDDLIRIIVQPYMLKYSRMIVPKSSVEFFTPPEAGQSIQVKLVFSDQSEVCSLKHNQYSNTDYIQLLLKGKAKTWFVNNFTANSTILLEPRLDGDDKLIEFHLGKPDDFSQSIPVASDGDPENYLFLSVRPDWRDSKSLLGYYNPIDQQYHSTPFLEFIKRACESHQRQEKLAWFILLDEMNLARVEYYFSDLLSILESGRDGDGWSREPIRLDYPIGGEVSDYQWKICLPPNLYIIGTVNVDETTHAFSPKVLDRAFTLELSDADFTNYPIHNDGTINLMSDHQRDLLQANFTRDRKFALIEKAEIAQYLENDQDLRQRLGVLNSKLQAFDLHFGYRVLDEITSFLSNADQNGFYDDLPNEDPLDAAILMKVLPKFHGSRTKLEEPLKEVLAWCINSLAPNIDQIDSITQNGSGTVKSIIQELEHLPYQYPHTANRIIRMIRSLYTTGFASFG